MVAEAKPDDGELPPPNGFSELDDYYRHMNLPVCGILLNRKCWGIYRFDPQANNKDTHVVAYIWRGQAWRLGVVRLHL